MSSLALPSWVDRLNATREWFGSWDIKSKLEGFKATLAIVWSWIVFVFLNIRHRWPIGLMLEDIPKFGYSISIKVRTPFVYDHYWLNLRMFEKDLRTFIPEHMTLAIIVAMGTFVYGFFGMTDGYFSWYIMAFMIISKLLIILKVLDHDARRSEVYYVIFATIASDILAFYGLVHGQTLFDPIIAFAIMWIVGSYAIVPAMNLAELLSTGSSVVEFLPHHDEDSIKLRLMELEEAGRNIFFPFIRSDEAKEYDLRDQTTFNPVNEDSEDQRKPVEPVVFKSKVKDAISDFWDFVEVKEGFWDDFAGIAGKLGLEERQFYNGAFAIVKAFNVTFENVPELITFVTENQDEIMKVREAQPA